MNNIPTVAVVIVNYNGMKYLPDCLASLQETDYPADKWQLVVVDNDSQDSSLKYIADKFGRAQILAQSKNHGFAEGNNIGMRWAMENNYDYVYLLNQDTIVTPQWLQQAVTVAQQDDNFAAVQSKLRLWPEKDKLNSVGNNIHYLGFGYTHANGEVDQGKYDSVREINYPSGAGVLLRLAALQKTGLFDKTMFMYLEDLDLGWRLWLAGYKCVLAPESVVYHKYEFSRSMRQVYYFERNRMRVLLKNYKLPTLLLLIPACLFMELGQLFFALKNGWLGKKIKSYFYFANPHVWIYLGMQKRKVKSQRKLTDRQMLHKFTGKILFQHVDNPLLIYFANPILNTYLKFLRMVIWW